jgi:hypothetical protein
MLVANRMTPPRYPAQAVATVIPAAAHAEIAGRRLTPITTYRAPGQFRSGGEHKTKFQTGPVPRRAVLSTGTPSSALPPDSGIARF